MLTPTEPIGIDVLTERLERGTGLLDRAFADDCQRDATLDGLLDNVVTSLLASRPSTAQTVDHIDQIANYLAGHRRVMLAVLADPGKIVRDVPTMSLPYQRWMALCWLAEAMTGCVATGDVTDPDFAPGDLDLLTPDIARMRFLVLAEPLRHRGEPSIWSDEDAGRYTRNGLPDRVFGYQTSHSYIARFYDARWDWLRHLNEYQSRPRLARAREDTLEAELDILIRHDVSSPTPLTVDGAMSAEDMAFCSEIAELHLLPRFRLGAVFWLSKLGCRPWAAHASCVAVGVVAVAVLLALTGIFRPWAFTAAAIVAGAGYALGVAGVVIFGRLWALPWLLRLPAAATIGLFTLVALPGIWLPHPSRLWVPSIVLLCASYGYLLMEARNHGVAGRAAPGRALAVLGVGVVHALLVSLIGLVLFAPPFVGPNLTHLWSTGGLPAFAALVLSTAWCLTVGVFSQILWDDRPITAPLAHLQWRKER